MFLRFYGGPESRADEFGRIIESSAEPVSPAFLQGIFVSNKEKPEAAFEEAKALTKVGS